MNVGTKSLLFGAHQVCIHPWFVALAWWRLYGFPFDPRLWLCFIIHDWGYWGKPNMDGKEGETHPEWAARWMGAHFGLKWSNLCLYHSRFYCNLVDCPPSRLCYADKLVIVYEPWWLYLPRAWLSGEIHEYRKIAQEREGKYSGMMEVSGDEGFLEWYGKVCSYLKRWVYEQAPNDRRRRGKHHEWIECPKCESIEDAIVEHTLPWWTYIHKCSCGYIIMESEWTQTQPP